jgi:hypothetical protein
MRLGTPRKEWQAQETLEVAPADQKTQTKKVSVGVQTEVWRTEELTIY